jgi:hypothetical protein
LRKNDAHAFPRLDSQSVRCTSDAPKAEIVAILPSDRENLPLKSPVTKDLRPMHHVGSNM